MRIGTSLSRCVRDIYDGKVAIRDVLVIVARTNFDPEDDQQWSDMWKGYAGGTNIGSIWSQPEWAGYTDELEFRKICIQLKKQGKLHQPRQYGAHPHRLNHYWYDVVLSEEIIESNPSAKKAWENYKLIAGLS
jgi:hypothetical protein